MHIVLWGSYQQDDSTHVEQSPTCFNAHRALGFLPTHGKDVIAEAANVSMHIVLWGSYQQSDQSGQFALIKVSMHIVLWGSYQHRAVGSP